MAYTIKVIFYESGSPKTGLSPTVDIYRISDNTKVVNAASMTEVGGGFYKYSFTGYDTSEEYTFVADSVSLVGYERYSDGNIDVFEGDLANGGRLDTIFDSILTDTGTTLDNHLTDIKGTGFVKDTNSLVDLPLASNYTATRAGYIDELAAANIPADLDAVLADTNELQGDLTDGGRLDLLIDAIKANTDNLPSGVPKNVALSNFPFLMIDSTDHVSPKTGLTITAQISKDGGAFAACSNSAAEIANGVYDIDLTQTEMNANTITLKFTASGADQRTITIVTST